MEKRLENMTMAELVEIYNSIADRSIKAFKTKAEGIRRIQILQDTQEPKETMLEETELEKTELEKTELEKTELEKTEPPQLKTNVKINLTNPNDLKFPELVVLTELQTTGKNENGDKQTITLDPKLRMAGHIVDGNFLAVRSIKTDQYRETSHEYTFNTIAQHLRSRNLGFGVWKTRYNAPHDHMTVDMLLKKQYHINEELFETDIGISYNDHDSDRIGMYQPMIRLTNSFFSASKVEFALVRILCANGMYRIADKLSLSFNHLDKNILTLFDDKTDEFMASIFEEQWIENFIEKLSSMPLKSTELFLNWLITYAGKRNADRAITKFKLTVLSQLNMWIVYNIVTWLTTHQISNLRREQNMFQKLKELN